MPLRNENRPEHLPECEQFTLSQKWPDQERPDNLNEHQWSELLFLKCADGCPILQRDIERGEVLAEEHGW